MTPAVLEGALWPEATLGEALAALARTIRKPVPGESASGRQAAELTPENFDAACTELGLECEEVPLHAHRIEQTLRSSAPAVLQLENHGWAIVTETRENYARLLTPALAVRKVPLNDLRQILCRRSAEPHRAEVERLLNECGIAVERRPAAFDALLDARMQQQPVGLLHAVSVPPGANFLQQLRAAGVLRWFVAMLGAHAAENAFLVAAWAVIGRAALQGRVDPGMLMAWLLLLAAMLPCRMLTTWAQGVLTVRTGGLLRQRLLAGALRLTPEEIRHEGAGAFLARAIDTETVESLALAGGLSSLLALVELLAAAWVLGAGGALLELPLLAAWCGVTAFMAWRYTLRRREWTDARLKMTHDQVDLMVGHRTRLAQQPRADWHRAEDQRLDAYHGASRAMDAHGARLEGLVPRGWFLTGVLGLAPTFLAPQSDPVGLAISLGGVVLAWHALRRLTSGLSNLSGAIISWNGIRHLFHAAARSEIPAPRARVPAGGTVIEARDLSYQYSGHGPKVIQGLDLRIQPGERLLVQGRSGGGKSTLVGLLAGLRTPTAGLLLSGGLDRGTLGSAQWLRRVSAAPQYHENHVLAGPLAYNLLLGRRWPPTEVDLRDADEVARDAGLGPLLDRMPGGLMQMVGETGWQLSSGERSRLFLCRALLSRAELVILDESFAALDPQTLRQALECSLRRAKTLMVVAHP